MRSASRFVLWRPRRSIPRTQRDTITERAAARITSGYSSSRISAVCCFESFSRRERAAVGEGQPLEVEQHRGRDERPGERAAPRLVGAGHVAAAELTVEREQPASVSAAGPSACESCVARAKG